MPATLEGHIDKIVFSGDNNFIIAKMVVEGRNYPVTVKGTLPDVKKGEKLKLAGSWEKHVKFGDQFSISSYESVMPITTDGIIKFLGSGLIKGIGPVKAKKIVAKYGLKTLDVIENEIDRLLEIEGIGEKWLGVIQESFREQKEAREFMPALQSIGITPAYATKIYKVYGKEAVDLIKANPYRLTYDIVGIGFKKADEIAGKIGISKDSPMRAEAGTLYMLDKMAGDGHVFYPWSLLIKQCVEDLGINSSVVEAAVRKLTDEKKIILETLVDDTFMGQEKAVYLSMYYYAEKGIAAKIKALLAHPKNLPLNIDETIGQIKKQIKAQEKEDRNFEFTDEQLTAIKEAALNNILVLTGGPGSGKTETTKAIIRLYDNVMLMAPTGRAAKKMQEATGHPATTIHRGLEYSPQKGGFMRDENNPLDADLVIVDESSMKDCMLAYQLLKAIAQGTTLVYVGDIDQIMPVGAGSPFKDIINSGIVKTVRLTQIHRQAQSSMIVTAAHSIKEGKMPALFRTDGRQDLFFFEIAENENILKKIVTLVTEEVPQSYGYNPINDIQVLTPIHKGVLGTLNLNAELQKLLNPGSRQTLTRGEVILKVGDKVLQRKNNRLKDVYNGDIGIVSVIDEESQEISVNYDGRIVVYDFLDIGEIRTLAYAITTHKSQGSEYPVVIMPMTTSHYIMLQRNLVYTGVTRGKALVILVGTKKSLAMAIKNNKQQQRYTMLEQRLKSSN